MANNRVHSTTVITLQEQFDGVAVTRLKRFHQDYFRAPNSGSDAKDAALEFQRRLLAEATELERLASNAVTYPFLAVLNSVVEELKSLAGREWAHCLKNLPEFQEPLLDVRESTIDPLKSFYNGARRSIYDDIQALLRDEAANFADVTGTEVAELREVLGLATVYKGNTLQQAKSKLETLRGNVAAVVTAARTFAITAVDTAWASVLAAPEFGSLSPEEKNEVQRPFTDAKSKIQGEHLAPVIRQIAERTASEVLPRQLQRVSELVTQKKPQELKDGGPKQYVAARLIPIVFDKAILESESDLEGYLNAVRQAYSVELKNRKRITL